MAVLQLHVQTIFLNCTKPIHMAILFIVHFACNGYNKVKTCSNEIGFQTDEV